MNVNGFQAILDLGFYSDFSRAQKVQISKIKYKVLIASYKNAKALEMC